MATLMSIPPECRLNIFKHYFNDEANLAKINIYLAYDTPNPTTPRQQCRIGETSNLNPALFLLSRQIATEARTQYRIHMDASIQHSTWLEDVECFLGVIPAGIKNSIRTLEVTVEAVYDFAPNKEIPNIEMLHYLNLEESVVNLAGGFYSLQPGDTIKCHKWADPTSNHLTEAQVGSILRGHRDEEILEAAAARMRTDLADLIKPGEAKVTEIIFYCHLSGFTVAEEDLVTSLKTDLLWSDKKKCIIRSEDKSLSWETSCYRSQDA